MQIEYWIVLSISYEIAFNGKRFLSVSTKTVGCHLMLGLYCCIVSLSFIGCLTDCDLVPDYGRIHKYLQR